MDLVKILHATIKFQIIKNCKREKHDLDFLKKKIPTVMISMS